MTLTCGGVCHCIGDCRVKERVAEWNHLVDTNLALVFLKLLAGTAKGREVAYFWRNLSVGRMSLPPDPDAAHESPQSDPVQDALQDPQGQEEEDPGDPQEDQDWNQYELAEDGHWGT